MNLPIDIFSKSYCRVCVNHECVRSLAGSKFNLRAKLWEEKLFINVPRADENDPKYAHIKSKRFIPLDPDPTSIYSAPSPFIDIPVPENSAPGEIKIIEEPELPSEIPVAAASEVPKARTKPKKSKALKQEPAQTVQTNAQNPMNTQFEQGSVIPGAGKDVFIESGESFTFGGDNAKR